MKRNYAVTLVNLHRKLTPFVTLRKVTMRKLTPCKLTLRKVTSGKLTSGNLTHITLRNVSLHHDVKLHHDVNLQPKLTPRKQILDTISLRYVRFVRKVTTNKFTM